MDGIGANFFLCKTFQNRILLFDIRDFFDSTLYNIRHK